MKKQSVMRLTSSVYNTPHLITSDSLEKILTYLDLRNNQLIDQVEDDEENTDDSADKIGNVGYIKVHGALTYKPVMGMCGEVQGTSYIGLLEQVESLIEEGVSVIVMDFSSPGGQASHINEYSKAIRKLATDNNVELIAYVDEMACSGGYWLACECDEVIANPDSTIGSIGVVVALTDFSVAMEKAGIKRVFITAGANKVPFDTEGKFKPEFLAKVQKEVDDLNEKFAAHVSEQTGLSVQEVKDLSADTFTAEEALSIGLINSIKTHSEFVEYISAKVNKEK